MVYPTKTLVCQVIAHQLLEETPAIVDVFYQEGPVESVVHFKEADNSFHYSCEFVLELICNFEILRRKLVIPGEDVNLHNNFDDVLHQLLCLLLIARITLGEVVGVVQDGGVGVVDEVLGYALVGHLAQEFLLRLQADVARSERVAHCNQP